eukprot:gene9911-12154_t
MSQLSPDTSSLLSDSPPPLGPIKLNSPPPHQLLSDSPSSPDLSNNTTTTSSSLTSSGSGWKPHIIKTSLDSNSNNNNNESISATPSSPTKTTTSTVVPTFQRSMSRKQLTNSFNSTNNSSASSSSTNNLILSSKHRTSSSSITKPQPQPQQPPKLDIYERRSNILREILTTEQAYNSFLSIIVNVYLLKLREKEILPSNDVDLIFSNIEAIQSGNQELLSKLRERIENQSPPPPQLQLQSPTSNNPPPPPPPIIEISDIFIEIGPFLKIYSIFECKYNPDAKKLDLNDLLIMPIQRLPRYILLISELIQYTPLDCNEYQKLQESLEVMKDVASYVNLSTTVQHHQPMELIARIQQKLGPKTGNLIEQHRRLIRSGSLYRLVFNTDGSVPQKRKIHIYLFNDLIIYAVGGKFWRKLKLAEVWVQSCKLEQYETAFEIHSKSISCIFIDSGINVGVNNNNNNTSKSTSPPIIDWVLMIQETIDSLLENDSQAKEQRKLLQEEMQTNQGFTFEERQFIFESLITNKINANGLDKDFGKLISTGIVEERKKRLENLFQEKRELVFSDSENDDFFGGGGGGDSSRGSFSTEDDYSILNFNNAINRINNNNNRNSKNKFLKKKSTSTSSSSNNNNNNNSRSSKSKSTQLVPSLSNLSTTQSNNNNNGSSPTSPTLSRGGSLKKKLTPKNFQQFKSNSSMSFFNTSVITHNNNRLPHIVLTRNNIIKEGYLTKIGEIVKNWKRRWFIFENGYLFYLRNQSSSKVLGTIPLIGSKIDSVQLESKSFSVVTKDRTYLMIADTEQDTSDWVSKFNNFYSTREDKLKTMRMTRSLNLTQSSDSWIPAIPAATREYLSNSSSSSPSSSSSAFTNTYRTSLIGSFSRCSILSDSSNTYKIFAEPL